MLNNLGIFASMRAKVSLPPANVVCEGYVFTPVCHSVHRGGGACVVVLGGHAWLLRGEGACVVALGGVHGCSGACVVAQGVCMVAPRGACMVAPGGACMVAPEGHVWLLPGGHCMVFPGGALHGFSWGGGVHRIWRDTVNERAVRILLECILVNINSLNVADVMHWYWLTVDYSIIRER